MVKKPVGKKRSARILDLPAQLTSITLRRCIVPVVSVQQAVLANVRGTNILADTQYATASRVWSAQIYATCSAIGIELDAFVDGEEMCRGAVVNPTGAQPIIPDDLLVPGIIIPRSANFLVTPINTTAGTLTANIMIVFTPLRG